MNDSPSSNTITYKTSPNWNLKTDDTRRNETQEKQNQKQNQKKKKKEKNQTTPVIANAATATAACKASSRQASRRSDVKSEAEANLVLGDRRQREAGRSHHDTDA
jgi:hypothetical protein